MVAYLPQVLGFGLALLGMNALIVADVGRFSNPSDLIIMGLLLGWLSAVFGQNVFKQPKRRANEMLPVDPKEMRAPYRVSWVGLVVYVVACAIPIGVNVTQHGWTDRNFLGLAVAGLALALGIAKGAWDIRADRIT